MKKQVFYRWEDPDSDYIYEFDTFDEVKEFFDSMGEAIYLLFRNVIEISVNGKLYFVNIYMRVIWELKR